MIKNSQDELTRAYAILQSLRKNIGDINNIKIEETYVKEYHTALSKLISIGIDVSEFEIPSSEITSIPVAHIVTIQPGQSIPRGPLTKEKYVDKKYLLMKIDTVLNYLEIILSEKPKRMGYNTNKE
jgi:hypothetical protein